MSSGSLSTPYFFRKLRSRIFTLCFLINGSDTLGIRDQINLHMMKVLFLGDNSHKNKFVHFINTPSEISLFLDKNSMDRFTHDLSPTVREVMNADPSCFRAAEIFSLENDLHSPGVTSLVSGKLAAKGISCICCNSFNSSFILIPDNYFSAACAIFKAIADPSGDEEDVDE